MAKRRHGHARPKPDSIFGGSYLNPVDVAEGDVLYLVDGEVTVNSITHWTDSLGITRVGFMTDRGLITRRSHARILARRSPAA
jgi:hypothetical protein